MPVLVPDTNTSGEIPELFVLTVFVLNEPSEIESEMLLTTIPTPFSSVVFTKNASGSALASIENVIIGSVAFPLTS
jgi:predicted Na+-dependent transporter